MKVLVTGASGFVGNALVNHLDARGTEVLAAVRNPGAAHYGNAKCVTIPDVGAETNWQPVLEGVKTVVHAAGRVHVPSSAADTEMMRVNVCGTASLAKQAVSAGVRRFIFVSSIKVNGEATVSSRPFSPESPANPRDTYAQSKHEAEQLLQDVSLQSDMEAVVIRPPLVYGPGVRANFRAMMRWVQRGRPVPLACVENRRSLVALDNLVDLITTCITHPAAANQTFMVSDDEDVSSGDLVCRLGIAFGKPVKLLPVPVSLLRMGAALAGKRGQVERLLGSLQVDISKTRKLLGWSPVVSMNAALEATVRHYLERPQT